MIKGALFVPPHPTLEFRDAVEVERIGKGRCLTKKVAFFVDQPVERRASLIAARAGKREIAQA